MIEAKRVAIVYNEAEDIPRIYADEGVVVYSVCEFAKDDRIYRLSPNPIPDQMLQGPIGHKDDGSAATTRIRRYLGDLRGESPFKVIEGGSDD